ncbi:hypothetical protein D3C81_737900 [compost metagenome]
MSSKIPVISINQLIEKESGIRNNISLVDNVLILSVDKTTPTGEYIYNETGSIEFKSIDLEQYYLQITKIDVSMSAAAGNTCKIYTATSMNRVTYEDYKEINSDGTINSTQGRYLNIKIEFIGKKDNVSFVKNDFKLEEKVDFIADDNIIFDDSAYLKTQYSNEMLKGTVQEGQIFTTTIEKSQFKKIDSLEVN